MEALRKKDRGSTLKTKEDVPQDLRLLVADLARAAKAAARTLRILSSAVKDQALEAMAAALEARREEILTANRRDLEALDPATTSEAFIDRLKLDEGRIGQMAQGLREVAALPDPVGEVTSTWRRPNGLLIERQRVPLGVIGIIYESRPNVTADAAGLCLKAGNAVILRGGSEAFHTNEALARFLEEAGRGAGLPLQWLQIVPTTDRAAVREVLSRHQEIDLIVPRGGESLVQMVREHSRIPVVYHEKGLCHVYVDAEADLEMATRIVLNAKAQRPGVCNAMETLLVHRDVAEKFLRHASPLLRQAGVELRGCPETQKILPEALAATEADWETEYLALVLSIRVVPDLDAAVSHIERYGSGLSEAIVTRDDARGQEFLERVDAAAVYVNASTRFTDGNQFGFGAELGISTQKLHARGPMGLEELTSYKYIIHGDGQVRT